MGLKEREGGDREIGWRQCVRERERKREMEKNKKEEHSTLGYGFYDRIQSGIFIFPGAACLPHKVVGL